jgi:hypothetical protein
LHIKDFSIIPTAGYLHAYKTLVPANIHPRVIILPLKRRPIGYPDLASDWWRLSNTRQFFIFLPPEVGSFSTGFSQNPNAAQTIAETRLERNPQEEIGSVRND